MYCLYTLVYCLYHLSHASYKYIFQQNYWILCICVFLLRSQSRSHFPNSFSKSVCPCTTYDCAMILLLHVLILKITNMMMSLTSHSYSAIVCDKLLILIDSATVSGIYEMLAFYCPSSWLSSDTVINQNLDRIWPQLFVNKWFYLHN